MVLFYFLKVIVNIFIDLVEKSGSLKLFLMKI